MNGEFFIGTRDIKCLLTLRPKKGESIGFNATQPELDSLLERLLNTHHGAALPFRPHLLFYMRCFIYDVISF